ncbi:uncharacterized protein LOC6523952 [Drosophila yakuba]|uniref:Uncharacterized protein n=1 Tax=Drosophila yakuba TaxID=7245 RepID=B4PY59_DROYA|nr:uncharacterized protein LOC6523952 [Drosophila yakuba]EDX00932.1 uncharacterized protein Dyak_GE16510 [Drosophila yakuba]
MRPKTEMNLQTSIWINKSFESSLLSSPKPVPSGSVDYHAMGSAKANRKGKRAATYSRFSRSDRAAEDPARQFASLAVKSNDAVASSANEPFFASNLKYYPHLPQPTWVGHYQTYAEIKALWLEGNYSQLRGPIPPSARPRRDYSFAHEVPDEPPKPVPNRRYSVNRRNGARTGKPMPSFVFTVNNHLPGQAYPEVQMQQEQPVQDLKEKGGSSNKPATSISKGAIPKQPKKYALSYKKWKD